MTKGYRSVTRGYNEYEILQRVTVGYKGFHGVYKGLQGLKRFIGEYERLFRVTKGS